MGLYEMVLAFRYRIADDGSKIGVELLQGARELGPVKKTVYETLAKDSKAKIIVFMWFMATGLIHVESHNTSYKVEPTKEVAGEVVDDTMKLIAKCLIRLYSDDFAEPPQPDEKRHPNYVD